MEFYLNEEKAPRALLIGVDTGEYDAQRSMDELGELARTAGCEVIGVILQNRPSIDKGTCIGSGRLIEAGEFCRGNDIDLVIFDHELSSTQTRNIEAETDVRVVDRTTLILDIFAQRALSKEGRLQVELAQQRYRLPRLTGVGVEMSRLGAGIGTRGPGETKLETDKRHIRTRIRNLQSELDDIVTRREQLRSRRRKDGVLSVAIVGYTNVGKSTLLNKLTDAGVLADNMLFATLDPISRTLLLPDGRNVLLIDTVGLISRLPHHLVEAFKSTLEEASNADVILHICDVSNPDVWQQVDVTEKILDELGCGNIPTVKVMNKADLLEDPENVARFTGKAVMMSALTGEGIDDLLNAIVEALPPTARRMKLLIPYNESGLLNEIRVDGKVFSEEYKNEGTLIDALVDIKLLKRILQFEVSE